MSLSANYYVVYSNSWACLRITICIGFTKKIARKKTDSAIYLSTLVNKKQKCFNIAFIPHDNHKIGKMTMHKLTSILVCSTALILSACGGDSDSSGMTHYGSTTKPTTEACSVAGKTITGIEDKSCIYKDDSAQVDITLTCNNGRAILDGQIGEAGTFSNTDLRSGTIVFGYTIQCI